MTTEVAEKSCHSECGWKQVHVNHLVFCNEILDDTIHTAIVTRDLAAVFQTLTKMIAGLDERLLNLEQSLPENYSDKVNQQDTTTFQREVGYQWNR